MFKDADVIVFIGGFPRKKGMERKDLLDMNKKIFIEQSKALSAAKKTVRCVVVANPANTNAYILSQFNPDIPKRNITCLTRLDHNRAISQIMLKTKSRPEDVKGVMIFGNHSLTQYPGINNLSVKGKNVKDLVDKEWLEKQYIQNVQNRGGEILKVRGASSVFSAASATIDHLRDWYSGTNGQVVSMGVVSDGSYGVPKGLFSSFPVRCKDFEW
jgi:malate dehydrogenase